MQKLNEECAVFGVCLKNDAKTAPVITYNGLVSLQHRGQEGAGIASYIDGHISCYKNTGLVGEVFPGSVLENLPKSAISVGHTRYSTTGANLPCNVQPIVTEFLTGRIATAHNGNVINARKLKNKLKSAGINFKASSDSEVISSLIAYYTVQAGGDVLSGLKKAANELEGSFSLIVLTAQNQLMCARDGSGFRPMCIGKNADGYAIASESCALDGCDFEFVRDILPGEIIVFENGEIVYENVDITKKIEDSGMCIFEYVYFARPDSVLDNQSVFLARYKMGEILAKEHPADADVVCGVPESGLVSAMGYAAASGLPYVSGFVKNRYIGRSFIFPTQLERESAVRLKLNPLQAQVEGKRIVLLDDSIVRGTTSARIVRMLKNAGAKEVHMRISSPPFKHTCHFGTDIGSEKNLIATKIDTVANIAKHLGADSLGYISLAGLKTACSSCNLPFCTKCFSGNGDLTSQEKEGL